MTSAESLLEDRATLVARWSEARAQTDALFRIVRPEFLYDRPIPERHRVIFYIGHLEAFDWNLLSGALKLESFQPEYDRLFAFGIDPVEGGLPMDEAGDWPSLQQVNEYRMRVRETLDRGILDHGIDDADLAERNDTAFGQLMNVAFEHRLMHAETLAYIFHQMAFEKKRGPLVPYGSRHTPVIPGEIQIPAGRTILGLHRDAGVFGWDNEFEAITVDVPGFAIDKYKVTNGQFLQFLEAGGYDDRALWSEEAWNWKTAQKISHPAFWIPRGETWEWRSMFGAIPLPLDWPVYVSHAEANAYAKWSGQSLPAEAQWQRAAYGSAYNPASNPPEPVAGVYDPSAVNAVKVPPSAFGVEGMIANGWEWTSTRFGPLPNFRIFDCYPGYSAPFFDDKHFVLKGGSVRTAASMLRPTFRNWFQPHYQYVYAGFRCVREGVASHVDPRNPNR
jgi:iron(II)-dependent oxidoreductase